MALSQNVRLLSRQVGYLSVPKSSVATCPAPRLCQPTGSLLSVLSLREGFDYTTPQDWLLSSLNITNTELVAFSAVLAELRRQTRSV